MPELEVWLCPVHESLDKSGALEPLDNCVACLRAERDELRRIKQQAEKAEAALKEIADFDNPLKLSAYSCYGRALSIASRYFEEQGKCGA